MKHHLLITSLAFCSVFVAGCSATRAEHPSEIIADYCAAVQARDAGRVYALLDEEGRLGMDPETFARHFDGNYEAILRQAKELEAGTSTAEQIEIRAIVSMGSGDRADLVWRDDSWWLTRATPSRSAQESPQQTLEAFRNAISARNVDGALALLSAETRSRYLAELDALQAVLAEGEGEIIASGDVAVVVFPNGEQLHLVREDGVWRVHRFEASQ